MSIIQCARLVSRQTIFKSKGFEMTTMKELSESVSSLCDMLAEYNGRLISENKLRKLKEETNGTKPNKAESKYYARKVVQ